MYQAIRRIGIRLAVVLLVLGFGVVGLAPAAYAVSVGDGEVAQISTCTTSATPEAKATCIGEEAGQQINTVGIALLVALIPISLGLWLAWRAYRKAKGTVHM